VFSLSVVRAHFRFGRYARLALILGSVSLVSYAEDTITIRGLASLSHGDTFDVRRPPQYTLELQPSPGVIYTMDIGDFDHEYDAWEGFVEVEGRLADCEDIDLYRFCKMSIQRWRPIDEVPIGLKPWKHLLQN